MTSNTLLFGFNLPPACVNICLNPVLRAAAPANIRHCGEPAGAERHFSFSGCRLWSGSFNISLQLCHTGSQWCEMNEWMMMMCEHEIYILLHRECECGMCFFFRLRCCSRRSLDPLCSHSLTAEPPPDAAALLSYRLSPLQTGYFQLASLLLLLLLVVVVVVASWVLVCVCRILLWEDFNQVSRPVELFLESFASWCSQSPLCQKDSVPPVVERKAGVFTGFIFKEAFFVVYLVPDVTRQLCVTATSEPWACHRSSLTVKRLKRKKNLRFTRSLIHFTSSLFYKYHARFILSFPSV